VWTVRVGVPRGPQRCRGQTTRVAAVPVRLKQVVRRRLSSNVVGFASTLRRLVTLREKQALADESDVADAVIDRW